MNRRLEYPRSVDLEADDPSPEELRLRLCEAVDRARRARLAVLTVHHAAAGPNRSLAEKVLRELRLKRLLGGTIGGVDFSENSYSTRVALCLHPDLAAHPCLNRGERGVTLAFLGSKPMDLRGRRFRFQRREGEQN